MNENDDCRQCEICGVTGIPLYRRYDDLGIVKYEKEYRCFRHYQYKTQPTEITLQVQNHETFDSIT